MSKGREIEMVVMMVGIVLFMSIQFMPSLAQRDCWDRIQRCVAGTDSAAEFQQECCTTISQEISTERECFCSVKPILDQNATLADTVSTLLSLCDGVASFNTICSGAISSPTEAPASSPIGSPLLSPSDSLLFPSPESPPGFPSIPELIFPPAPGLNDSDNDSDNGSGSNNTQPNSTNKTTILLGLLPKALLFIIWAILVSY